MPVVRDDNIVAMRIWLLAYGGLSVLLEFPFALLASQVRRKLHIAWGVMNSSPGLL
jgi:hypothetical protein